MTDWKKQVEKNRERERKIALSKCLRAKKKLKNEGRSSKKSKKHKANQKPVYTPYVSLPIWKMWSKDFDLDFQHNKRHNKLNGVELAVKERVMNLTRKKMRLTIFLKHPDDNDGPL